MPEYEMLRQEMLQEQSATHGYNNLMYTATAAILAFTIEKSQFILCMLPLIVIIPVFLLCENLRKGQCKIAAYMYVFLEGNEYNWETRHHKLDAQQKHRDWRGVLPYYTLLLICTSFSVYKCVQYFNDIKMKVLHICILCVISLICALLMATNTTNYIKCRDNYIERWRAIYVFTSVNK